MTATNFRTPLYSAHLALGARTMPFGGWDMPVQYSGILAEVNAVRTLAGSVRRFPHGPPVHLRPPGHLVPGLGADRLSAQPFRRTRPVLHDLQRSRGRHRRHHLLPAGRGPVSLDSQRRQPGRRGRVVPPLDRSKVPRRVPGGGLDRSHRPDRPARPTGRGNHGRTLRP